MNADRRNDYYYHERIAAYRESDEEAPQAIVKAWDTLAEFLHGRYLVEAAAHLIDTYESKAAGGRSG